MRRNFRARGAAAALLVLNHEMMASQQSQQQPRDVTGRDMMEERRKSTQGQLVISLDEVKSMLEEQRKVFTELVPVAPNEMELRKIKSRLEAASMTLIRTYLVADSRDQMMDTVCGALNLTERVKNAKSNEEVDNINEELKSKYEAAENDFVATLTDKFIKRNALYKQHQEELNEIFEDFDGGKSAATVASVGQPPETVAGGDGDFIPTTDPITKTFLIEPVKNKICGHVYGKASILYFISNNARARCPYPGCSSMEFLQKNNLVGNAELSQKIAAKVKEAQKRKDTTSQSQKRQQNSVHLDEDEAD